MTNMALHMENRGKKSWGWSDGSQIVKALGAISDGWNYSFNHSDYITAALHTRHPTTGNLIADNSHPFKIGDIIGMHNGMVSNHADLQQKYNRTCAVDSEHIFHHINDGLSLSDVSAYGAIVYWKDGVIHIGRFNNGDLHLAKTEVAWVFASTKIALQESLRFAGLNKNVIYMQLKEGRLYKLVNDDLQLAGDLDFSTYTSKATWQTATTTYPTYTMPNNSYRGPVIIPPPATNLLTNTSQEISVGPSDEVKLAIDVINKMVVAAVDKAKEVNDSLPSEGSEAWECALCKKGIDGNFHVSDEFTIICDLCSTNIKHRVLNIVALTKQPIDITDRNNLSTSYQNGVPRPSCESCTNYFDALDSIVISSFSNLLCIDCFISGEGEQYIDDTPESMYECGDDVDAFYKDYEDDEIKVTILNSGTVEVTHKDSGVIVEYPKGTSSLEFLQEV